ncbi:hypothetical protein GCM10027162_06570 [Streptomyces incanus]
MIRRSREASRRLPGSYRGLRLGTRPALGVRVPALVVFAVIGATLTMYMKDYPEHQLGTQLKLVQTVQAKDAVHTPPGTRVDVSDSGSDSVAADGDTGTAARIRIADEGPGIPAEDRERMFDRFYRVDKARSRDRGGSGLGLAVARSLVRAHGGDIELSAGRPGPTVFTVRLPLTGPGATGP